jgi:hypothetical protein
MFSYIITGMGIGGLQMVTHLSKMNRGVVLGAILLICLSGYFVYDARAFEKEAHAVGDAIIAFVGEAQEINAMLASDIAPDEKRRAAEDYVNRFFTEYRASHRHRFAPSVRQSTFDALEAFIDFGHNIIPSAVSLTLSDISSMQKQSADAVSVAFTLWAGRGAAPAAVYFDGFGAAIPDINDGRIDVNALLFRVGGEWLFADAIVRGGGGRIASFLEMEVR